MNARRTTEGAKSSGSASSNERANSMNAGTRATERRVNPWMEDELDLWGHRGLVVDLGCGRGWWLRRMAAEGITAVGVEPDRQRAKDAGRRAVVGDGRRVPLASGCASVVWCIHVLHHLSDPTAALREARRLLNPGGVLILAETVEDHPAIRLARSIRPEWDGVAVASRFTANGCLNWLDESGFAVVDHRQHSLVSFAAWTIPVAPRRLWVAASRAEDWLTERSSRMAKLSRWGAHLECVARAV
jgi:SAM-dependent methyltransferase